jgi:hypothetical protein
MDITGKLAAVKPTICGFASRKLDYVKKHDPEGLITTGILSLIVAAGIGLTTKSLPATAEAGLLGVGLLVAEYLDAPQRKLRAQGVVTNEFGWAYQQQKL